MSRMNSFHNIYDLPKKNIPCQIYQLKITLKDINPPIWRRILVSNYSYFSELHDLIQICFSWEGYHLHEFSFPHPFISNLRIYIKGVIDWDIDSETADYYHFQADNIRLCDVFSETQRRAFYTYDFGDNWEHVITLEKIFPNNQSLNEPICVGGKRASPPEDSGGPYGYQEIIEILNNSKHPEYDSIIEWLEPEFNSETIDELDIKMSPKDIEKTFGPSLEELRKTS